ncbi:dihydroxyacetone kinase phosphoryl donor subunit DhaM [Cellulomonas chengniuliangii]|uniref:Phosphocarrier protein HPr n=1 Tax=Cellulomonas chengniuliangii TaxID=2968084 RepID=A0ABY5KX07_9CELL|nr:dihydroxyacetone kinase phosphoryl donor subunit DhaM [Cellulomonas chengniuliangii]MCC2309031.1 PTS-dependent dihydroxyacetone kinase phosphotransferase subunit DhaM [Cellulomonas chengniuliangii]UUI74238.1 dihydroxyacetone kinase phosphoryl donor subunit DhaM [Cellulomonas chengniuliangii]
MTASATARVALVLVSHSDQLARGAVELAAQMAPNVLLVPAGGDGTGGLGTSFEQVERALDLATAEGRSAVVLTDLGSAVLTTESVLDLADPELAARVRLADAPFVEGAVAAAVTAHGGADLDAVLAAAEHAGSTFAPTGDPGTPAAAVPSGEPAEGEAVVALRNPLGLHARPAAVLARMVAGFDAAVTVDGVNAASVLELMKLGAAGGQSLTVRSTGPEGRAALDAVVAAIEGGFGEV